MYGYDPSDIKEFDKTPHEIFVQMSELNDDHTLWVEKSRWIKYEECKEEGQFSISILLCLFSFILITVWKYFP